MCLTTNTTVVLILLTAVNVGFSQEQKQKPGKRPFQNRVIEARQPARSAGKKPADSTKVPASEDPGQKQPESAPASSATGADESRDEAAIRQSAAAFVQAYNAHDAKAISELFAVKAEFLDEDGNLIKGREAIQNDFQRMFDENPKCSTEIAIESIRVLTSHIAVEEGLVRGKPTPDDGENVSRYIAVHINVDGHWKIASVRDTVASSDDLTPNDHLHQLAWMVGDWLDESPGAFVKSSCRWDDSGNYLLHTFQIEMVGNKTASGSMRIGWDPLFEQIRSWTFNDDGSFSEGLWTPVGDEWIVTVHGVNREGAPTSATSVYRPIDADTMTWRSYDRIIQGIPTDDIPEYVIKRIPPGPQE